MAPPTFLLRNLGCRANQADGDDLAAGLAGRGWSVAAAAPDCVIVNTCTVTAAADAEARLALRRLRRQYPDARLIVTGCYAQRAPEELAALDGVDLVAGNSHKHALPDLLAQQGLPKIVSGEILRQFQAEATPAGLAADRTRPLLKVQDGCDNRCSYCVIPRVRGSSRSLPLGATLQKVESLVAAGYQEVVLSGINLGQWGRDLDAGLRLPQLVDAILDRTGLNRLRLSSVEPMDWSPALLDRMQAESAHAQPRLARHVHAPLQSGSDTVLRRMHRRYRPWHYAERIKAIHALVPEAAIGADVMVGFPGETEAEFEQTHAFIAALPFTYLHLFTYSARPGTGAVQPEHAGDSAWTTVPAEVAATRHRRLQSLIAAKRARWLQQFEGATLPVLTLRGGHALSDNFIRVELAEPLPANQLLRVRVTAAGPDSLEACAA